jgi:hypothetical protein
MHSINGYFMHYDDLMQIEYIQSKNEQHLNETNCKFIALSGHTRAF